MNKNDVEEPKQLAINFKRENGYWDDIEVIKKILIDFHKQNDRLPTQKECRDLKIIVGLRKHGGIIKLSEILNLPTTTQYITLSNHIVKSTYEVIFANFCFLNNIKFEYEVEIIPKKKYRCDFKINDFFIEIWGCGSRGTIGKDYIKNRKIKEKVYKKNNLKILNLEYDLFDNNVIDTIVNVLMSLMKDNGIKNNDFCEDLSKINYFESFNKNQIFKIIKEECEKRKLTKFPSFKWWRRNGFKKQLRFLETHKISISILAEYCNLPCSEKPKKYWMDWENIINELLPICEELGKFPTDGYLRKIKKGIISCSIAKYHGGVHVVAKKLGYSTKEKPKNYWKDWENVKKELIPICEELKKIPTWADFRDIEKKDLHSQIVKYHKEKFEEFKKEFKEEHGY